MITGISHVNMTVPEGTLEHAAVFYTEVLGFHRVPVPHLQKHELAWFDITPQGQQVHIAHGMPIDEKSTRHPCFVLESPEALLEMQKRIWAHYLKGGPSAPMQADAPGENSGPSPNHYKIPPTATAPTTKPPTTRAAAGPFFALGATFAEAVLDAVLEVEVGRMDPVVVVIVASVPVEIALFRAALASLIALLLAAEATLSPLCTPALATLIPELMAPAAAEAPVVTAPPASETPVWTAPVAMDMPELTAGIAAEL